HGKVHPRAGPTTDIQRPRLSNIRSHVCCGRQTHNVTKQPRAVKPTSSRADPGTAAPRFLTRRAALRHPSIPVVTSRPATYLLVLIVELLLPLLVLPLVLLPILVLVPVLVPVFVLVLPVLVVPVVVLPEGEEDQVFLLPAGAHAPRQHLHWSPSLRGGWDGQRDLPPRGHHDRMIRLPECGAQGTRQRRSVKGFFGLWPGVPGPDLPALAP